MNLNKENMKSLYCLITFAVILYLGVQNIDIVLEYVGLVWGLILPFITGAAMAFVLNVPMSFAERKLFGKAKNKHRKMAVRAARPVSLLLAILGVLLVILLVALVVVPELGSTIASVGKGIEESLPLLQKWLEDTFHEDSPVVQWANSIDFHPENMLNSALDMLRNGVDNILVSTISVTRGILSTAMNVGIGFVFACYILLQKEKLSVQVKKAMYAALPEKTVKYLLHVASLASRIFSSFITGQCIEAVILGSMFFLVLTVGRFPYAMLIGVLVAFTALIPVFGAFIGCFIGFFLILIEDPMKAFVFLAVFLILQQIEGNLIYPQVVGSSVGLPAIWVLVAVTVGGSLMGVAGMLIFIPLVSVLYALFREWVYKSLEKKKLRI